KGLTNNLIEEMRRNLKKHGMIKVRILKSYRESMNRSRQELAQMIANLLDAELKEVRGYTFTLKRGS
ncbi:MAG: RNA-binding protein, partial [Thermoprotei archaeon]